MDYKIEYLDKFNDNRGELIVFLKNSNLSKRQKKFGQIYYVTFSKKGIVRGNHYHKKWREWFGVVAGKIEVVLLDIYTKERVTFVLNAKLKQYVRLEIGPNIAHSFKSKTNFAVLINYATGEWGKNDDFDYELLT